MASKTPIIGGILTSENNLSDVANAATARSNIGAGTGNGDMVGSNNLSDVANAATARSNIGAGTGNGNGDALTTNPLSQFAATTSAQLRGVMNDETGSGSLVFSDSPTFTTPNLGTASATQMTTTGNMIAQGQAYSQLNTLTPAAAIATDCNAGNVHKVTLNQNSTLSAPTNMVAGATYLDNSSRRNKNSCLQFRV